MKKRNLTLAILVMVVATLVSVAIVSCKKEDTVAPTGQHAAKAAFTPPQVDDMNAYLKAFKQRMQSAAKGDDEALSLDEAAWHLSSVANYEYANASSKFDNIEFDTLDLQVKLTDGAVSLSDLNLAYELMVKKIKKFQNSLRHDNQGIHFINVFISDNGNAKVAIMITYNTMAKNLDENYWYFDPSVNIDSICELYYYDDSTYTWDGTAVRELTRILNLFESYQNGPDVSYYTPAESKTFEYNYFDWFDQYGSPFYRDSRLCAFYDYSYHDLSMEEMCYCIDSYLGLGYYYLENANSSKRPVSWVVSSKSKWFYEYHDRSTTFFHKLEVQYGNLHTHNPGPYPQ